MITLARLGFSLLLTFCVILALGNFIQPREITLTVSPMTFVCNEFKPEYVMTKTRIEPDTDNRKASLNWGSSIGESGSTVWDLDEHSAITFFRKVRIDCAFYNFEACVYRVNKKFCDRIQVHPP